MKMKNRKMIDGRLQGQNYNHQQQQQQQQLLKIKVPKGKRKGDRFKVRLEDGRIIEATVPNNTIKEFYLDVNVNMNDRAKRKRRQNWHDNPLAVLPMTFGPLFL
mmetsp:Transcript_37392/g.41827  ORF Transcript_37392/g.41827 Transcript_37392/m.41827 type:complete len:104 (+) Transcript_37392:133-444(+)